MVSLRPLTARSYKSKSKKYKKISNFVVPTTGKFTANIHIKERRLSKKKNGIKTVESVSAVPLGPFLRLPIQNRGRSLEVCDGVMVFGAD